MLVVRRCGAWGDAGDASGAGRRMMWLMWLMWLANEHSSNNKVEISSTMTHRRRNERQEGRPDRLTPSSVLL